MILGKTLNIGHRYDAEKPEPERAFGGYP